jgi:hypothetical protein
MKSMQGVPYHVETLRRKEGDERRYWLRCKYAEYSTKFCRLKQRMCYSSVHCDCYSSVSETEFKRRQKLKYHHKFSSKTAGKSETGKKQKKQKSRPVQSQHTIHTEYSAYATPHLRWTKTKTKRLENGSGWGLM